MAKGQSSPQTLRQRSGCENCSGMNPGAVGSNPAADTKFSFPECQMLTQGPKYRGTPWHVAHGVWRPACLCARKVLLLVLIQHAGEGHTHSKHSPCVCLMCAPLTVIQTRDLIPLFEFRLFQLRAGQAGIGRIGHVLALTLSGLVAQTDRATTSVKNRYFSFYPRA